MDAGRFHLCSEVDRAPPPLLLIPPDVYGRRDAVEDDSERQDREDCRDARRVRVIPVVAPLVDRDAYGERSRDRCREYLPHGLSLEPVGTWIQVQVLHDHVGPSGRAARIAAVALADEFDEWTEWQEDEWRRLGEPDYLMFFDPPWAVDKIEKDVEEARFAFRELAAQLGYVSDEEVGVLLTRLNGRPAKRLR